MTQHGERDPSHIGRRHRGATSQQRGGFGTQNQRLAGARSRTPSHILRHQRRDARRAGARCAHQLRGISQHQITAREFAHQSLQRQHLLGAKNRHDGLACSPCRGAQNRDFLLLIGIAHTNIEQKAIQLRLRQRIRAFLLNRILRRQHKKWFR